MIKRIKLFLVLLVACSIHSYSQSKAINSCILNFGSTACGNKTAVTFSLIGNRLAGPYSMSSCAVNPPFSDVFSKFISYNPKDNKVYINDIVNHDSRIYWYDMGLPTVYTCPAVMPLTPTYLYNYTPNNFEFDINGDLWSIRSLKDSTAIIERFDEVTGTILATKTLNFPSDNTPNTLGTGDIVLTPNGRMFIVMGDNPGKFYEVTNYNGGVGNAKANFIQNTAKVCYAMAFMNGTIQLAGTNFNGSCYRYVYDIPSKVMGNQQTYQLNQTPIDNSSISPATGLSNQLMANLNVDSVTEDVTYQIVAKNVGNVRLYNFNVTEDLGALFGSGNVSNVHVAVSANPNNLVLDPSFDGITNTSIFLGNQLMSNLQNGYVILQLSFRVTNLISNKIYYNTAFSKGEMGNAGNRVAVIDSSNNGTAAVIDPNGDGDPGDYMENIPTPFYFGIILPVRFIYAKADRISNSLHNIKWSIAPPPNPVTKFEVEYSTDNSKWQLAGTVKGEAGVNNYYLNFRPFENTTTYYRIRAYETSGEDYLSQVLSVKNTDDQQKIKVTPNPADALIKVYCADDIFSDKRRISIIDISGKKIFDQPYQAKYMEVNSTSFPEGYYVVNVSDKNSVFSTQVLIKHK
ncbi:MAG: T9SS type A sorting domain-containing protein [Ferruginibacter sp.]